MQCTSIKPQWLLWSAITTRTTANTPICSESRRNGIKKVVSSWMRMGMRLIICWEHKTIKRTAMISMKIVNFWERIWSIMKMATSILSKGIRSKRTMTSPGCMIIIMASLTTLKLWIQIHRMLRQRWSKRFHPMFKENRQNRNISNLLRA